MPFLQDLVDRIPDTRESIGDIVDTIEEQAAVYIACFCTDDDLLSQWRGYGAFGGGYALGFDPKHIGSPEHEADGSNVILRKVIYDGRTQKRIVRSWVDGVARMERTLHEKRPELFEPDLKDPKGRSELVRRRKRELERFGTLIETEFRKFLSECLVSFKHPGYDQEAEWRAIYFGTKDTAISFRPSGGRIVPYVEVDVTRGGQADPPRLALKSITYGPTLDPEGADRSLKMLTGAHGLPRRQVNIKPSKIPFRQLG